jgi:outer membrane protein OmpA-like peptidoglycan-associated protein
MLATDRSDIDPPGDVAVRLDLGYIRSPLSLPEYGAFRHVVANELGLRAGIDVGVWNHLEIGAWVPVTLDTYSPAGQRLAPSGAGAATQYDIGAGDIRLFLKVNALKRERFGLAFVAAANLASGDQRTFRSDDWGADLRVVFDVNVRWFQLALNLGARLHDTLTTTDPATGATLLEIGSELTWAAAFGATVHPKAALFLEFVGSESFSPLGSLQRTAEALLSARIKATPALHFLVGIGRSLDPDSARADDFRVILGLAWHPAGAMAGRSVDSDGDGIPDDKDQCPREAEDVDGFADEDGCPDPDNDGDGIPDKRDQCPNEPEDKDGFQDTDGCPDADNDGDGIPDVEDWCPNQPGPTDNEGCPDNTPADKKTPPKKARESAELPMVRFARNSAELDAAAMQAVGRIADHMGAHPELKRVRLEGHAADGERSADTLSFERAQAVMRALAQRGVDLDRLGAVGYGARRPIGKRADDNRRVECIVVDLPSEAK